MDENDNTMPDSGNDTPEIDNTPEIDSGEHNPTPDDSVDPNAALQAAIKKYKVKVDGEEQEVDEEELLRGYQTTKAAQKRMSEAALARQQAEDLVRLAKEDPRKLLTHPAIGTDLKTFAEQILSEMMEEALMDPKEKELRDTKKKLAEFESVQKAAKEAQEAEQRAALMAHYEADISSKIASALDTSGLPKTQSTVKRMAQYMSLALEQGLDVEPKDVVELVRTDYLNEVKELFGSANEDVMMQLLGEDLTSKAVKAHLKKTQKPVQSKTPQRVAPEQQGVSDSKRAEAKKPLSRTEWKKKLEENKRNRG